MTARNPRTLLLTLAVSVALAACTQDEPARPAQEAPQPETEAAAAPAVELPPTAGLAFDQIDASIDACTDLNALVNSKWLAANPVPDDETTWGSFEMLNKRAEAASRQLVEAAAAEADAGGVEKLVGDIYATGMDEAAIEAAGIVPIQPMLDRIDALETADDVAQYIRDEFAAGRGEVFNFYSSADFMDSDSVIAYASQGGLSLPEKAYYLEDGPDGKYREIREAFVAHVDRQLQNAGVPADAAKQQAEQVLALETRLAEASLSRVELRDPKNLYNFVSVADAETQTPNFAWSQFFDANGVEVEGFSLSQPVFFAEFGKMLEEVPVEQWQAYLRISLIDAMAPFLSKQFSDERFAFYNQTLRGQKERKPRWERVLATVEGTAGEALGQLYVDAYFPAESKAAMETLVANLSAALKTRLQNLDWMSDATKEKALEKWATFTPKVGYPDKWREWGGLATSRDSYVGNVLAAAQFNHDFEMAKIGKPVDKTEWGMSPQTVNAYYNPLQNEIVFPAAILQPPFFDPEADLALNYGGIGAVIGHEMLHGYDDRGSQFDAQGNFANWWQKADREGFEARTAKLVEQFDNYVAIDGLHVNGELTLGENIADLGGLTVAWDALQTALADAGVDADAEIDGYTPGQRFFMNWATVWRRNYTPDELKVRLNTDSHAPAEFRAIGAPSNMPSFAAAFQCQPGDAMVRGEEQRVVIW